MVIICHHNTLHVQSLSQAYNITLNRITSGIQYHIHNILAMHISGLGQSNWVIIAIWQSNKRYGT